MTPRPMLFDRQFAAANEAVMQAVLEIECTITNLFDTTDPVYAENLVRLI